MRTMRWRAVCATGLVVWVGLAACLEAGTVTRSIAATTSTTGTVTLTVDRGTADCFAVEDTIPTGVTPSNYSNNGGAWDSVHGKVKWGPFTASYPPTLTYNYSIPTGTATLSGRGSFDGTEAATTGGSRIGAGPMASHSSTGYQSPGTCTVTCTITFTGSPSALGWQAAIPNGWSYASGTNEPGTTPTVGQTGTLEWAWTTIPASPVVFTYTLTVPSGQTGSKQITANAIYREGGLQQPQATPDPLVVEPVTYHGTDTTRDWKISLLELTRVIELYNYRSGTTRTGEYHVQAGTEDGFASGPGSQTGVKHSADTSGDWKMSLLELTRVIELYNYRSGTTRTGDYHLAGGTEDGYAPGPARRESGEAVEEQPQRGSVRATVTATHATAAPGTYSTAGGPVTVNCTLTFDGTPTALGWQATIPNGWSYASGTGEPDTKPSSGQTGTLEWAWTTMPTSPVQFSYTLSVPGGQTGDKQITASAIYRSPLQTPAATPDPLVIPAADTTPPTVTITSTAPSPTKTTPIPVTITFSEVVADFVVGDITVTNGTAGNFVGAGTTYTADITPSGQGAVTVNVAAGVAHDGAGNPNTAASPLTRTFDSQTPTVVITSAAPNPTKTSPIPVTITFSEVVADFVVGDITVTNGTAGNFAGAGTTYTADITSTGQGAVTVDLAAGVAQDAAGNNNTVAAQLGRTYDSLAPTSTIALANGQGDPTATKPVHFVVTFSENVSGFDFADIVFTGSTAPGTLAATVTGGPAAYDVAVDGMTGAGNVVIGFAAGAAQDTAGNPSTAPVLTDNTIAYDPTGLSVAINQATGQADPATGAADILFTAVFNKPVTDFATGDVALSGTAGGLGGIVPTVAGSGTTYQVSVPVAGITTNGTVIVTVPAGVAHDAAANPNLASTSTDNVVTFDRNPPTAANKTVATNEDTDLVFVAGDFNFADADAGDTLQAVEITSLPVPAGAGTLKVSGLAATAGLQVSVATINAGQVTFHPALYANGSPYTTFTFKVSDGTLWSTAAYTMTVNVTPVNNAPVITASSITEASLLVNGGLITVSVTANDNIDDPDGSDNALIQYSYEWKSGTTSLQSTGPKLGSTDTYLAIVPEVAHGLGNNYPVTVTVTVHDPQEPENVTVQTVTVPPLSTYVGNEPPVVSASSPASPQNISEGASVNFSATFTDVGHSPQDDGIKSIVWTVTGLTKDGKTTNFPSRAYTSPQTDTFTLSTNSNDVTHAGSPLVATVTATATDGLNVTGQQTWTINVTDVNTPPGLGTTTIAITKTGGTGLAGAPGKEDTLTATVTPGATDADTEDVAGLRYRVVWTDNTARATLKTTDLGVGVYTTTLTKAEHNAVRGRVITATVYALDSQDATSPTSAADTPPITIADTAPVGVADTGAATEDETLVFSQARAQAANVLNNDTDVDKVDGDALSVSAVDATSAKGAAVSKSGNVVTYDPRHAAQLQSLQVGDVPPATTDTFGYTVADSFGGSDTATVTVTVTGVNDAPFWPGAVSLDGGDADGTAADTKKYTATVTGGDPDDVDWDDVFVGGGRNGGTTLKIFYAWTNVVSHDVVYMDGSTVLSGFDPFGSGRTTLFSQIPVGTSKSTVKDNVPRSETWRVEAFVIDQRDAICDTPLTVYFGSPQWYPRFAWTAKPLPGRDAADAVWYNIQIWNDAPEAPGALVLDTNVQGTEMTPAAYFSAGSEGLLPGTYYWRYRAWDPVADVYGATWYPDSVRGSEQRIVDDYGHAAKPRDLGHTDNLNGNYTLGFTADNARGYELTITGPSGYSRTFLHVFAPDATGVIPLNQPSALDINLVTAGTYTWDVRGFNPLDDSDGTETWSDTDQIVLVAPGTPPDMAQQRPGGLQPPDGSLFRAPGEILLQWDSVPGAAGYLLYLGSSGGHLPYNYADIGAITSLRVNVLVGSYFWTVIAYDAGYVGSRPSVMARFDVIENAAAPVIQSVRVDAAPTILTIGVAAGTNLPATVDIRHFDADSGWHTYLAQAVVGVTATAGTVTIAGADFDVGEYVMISGTSAGGDVSPNKVLVISP